MSTPHNSAEKGMFANTVLMPGDPLRAKWIAESFLEDAELVTSVRNIYGYTGLYKGGRVSVMASGMGMPSMGIYSYELFDQYDVKNIIRIGSAGAYSPKIDLMDIVLAEKTWSESSFCLAQNGDESQWKYPNKKLNDIIKETAEKSGRKLATGAIHSSDVFYREEESAKKVDRIIQEKDLLCVEMESFALFHNAEILGKAGACLLTISDSFVNDTHLDAQDRQSSFEDMVLLALESAIRAEEVL